MQAQMQAIKDKVAECVARAEAMFGIKMPQVQILFDLTGRAAGMAGMRYGQFYLRFNVNHMRLGGKTWEHLINDTVPHEVAHTVCQAFPKFGRNHDTGWKRVCRVLGGTGQTRYSEDDAPEAIAQMRPYVYITTNGNEVRVTKGIHNKIQKGIIYSFRGGKGQINRACAYNYMAGPAVTAIKKPAAPTVPAAKKPEGGATKADMVRIRISEAKRRGEGTEIVVQWAVEVLGMKKALAKAYVKNNWAKA